MTFGGRNISNTTLSRIEKIEIASKGNSTKFGDLTENVRFAWWTSIKTRGVRIAGYEVHHHHQSTMDYVQIQTEGNAVYLVI